MLVSTGKHQSIFSYLPLLLATLTGLTKGCYNPISCDFLEEILFLTQGAAARNESSCCPRLQDPAALSMGRESKVLLGLDLVKLLSLTVLQAASAPPPSLRTMKPLFTISQGVRSNL